MRTAETVSSAPLEWGQTSMRAVILGAMDDDHTLCWIYDQIIERLKVKASASFRSVTFEVNELEKAGRKRMAAGEIG